MCTEQNLGKLLTFSQFISTHEVEIPRIQRDFTYGAETEQTDKVLNKLLNDIYEALDNEDELILDFVYGSNNERNGFEPLDGQQRLTTLFLLYIFAAWKSGKDAIDAIKKLKFGYTTRDNTSSFCHDLLNKFQYDETSCETISRQVTDCPFFRSSFETDPSIQSMLVVLDRIKDKFWDMAENGVLWERLNNENCPIKFYSLDFGKFGLSDELYIKMNSRGKPLTEYEIFKSQFEKYIEIDLADKELMYKTALKFDTDYTDLVWDEQSRDIGKIDSSLVYLIRNLFNLLSYLDGGKALDNKSPLGDVMKDVVTRDNIQFIHDFIGIFHKIYDNNKYWGEIFYSSDSVCGEDAKIRVFKTNINVFHDACSGMLKFADVIMLYAMYLGARQGLDGVKWRKNIRHIRNLVENTDLRAENMQSLLKETACIMTTDILQINSQSSCFNREQMAEEQEKERDIEKWQRLYRYENHDILRGHLSMFQCQNGKKTEPVYSDIVLSRLDKFERIFNSKAKTEDKRIRAALLTISDVGFGQNHTDVSEQYGCRYESWRMLFTLNGYYDQSKIIRVLDECEPDNDNKIIRQSVSTTDWRYYASKYYGSCYRCYNGAGYGFFYCEDWDKTLNMYQLQSTQYGDNNVMYRMMNAILHDTLKDKHGIAEDRLQLGRYKKTPELIIDKALKIDILQTGWKFSGEKADEYFARNPHPDVEKTGDCHIYNVKPEQDYIKKAVEMLLTML